MFWISCHNDNHSYTVTMAINVSINITALILICHTLTIMATPTSSSEKASEKASKAMQKSLEHVVSAISSSDPLGIGVKLFTNDLISEQTLHEVKLVSTTPLEKSTTLALNVLGQVKIVPDKLSKFLEVLQESIDESSFQSKCN